MTLEFDNSRTTYKTGSPVRILRVPAGGIESACIICDNAVQHGVHWFHDRTVPHFDEKECPYCEDAETLRREWYLSVWIPAWNWVRIIAITDFAMHPVITHREREGGLRGTECRFKRKDNQAKGRLSITVCGPHPLRTRMPDSIRTEKHLEAVWEQNSAHVAHKLSRDLAGQFVRKMRG